MSRNRYPKRARARWLEGAPEWVCDCFDDRGEGDRYTVFLTGPEWGAGRDGWAAYFGIDEHGQIFSGEMRAHEFAQYRYRNGKKRVRWIDLPEAVRRACVIYERSCSIAA